MAQAADPLKSIEQLIAQAAVLPEPEAYRPSPTPLVQLSNAMRGVEADAAPAVAAPAPRAAAAEAPDLLEAVVGREVLALVSERPLSAAARAEAVRRLSLALQHPSPQNVRAVLAVLVSDRVDV